MRRMMILLSALLTLVTAAVSAGPLPDNTVCVWYQPISSFQKWHDRGVTTILGYESENGVVSKQQWKQALKQAGLTGIIQSTALDPSDNTDPLIIGVMVAPDEPDGGGAKTPGQIVDTALNARQIAPNKPLGVNFDGNRIPWVSAATYAAYCSAVDFVCFDQYPFNYGCQTVQNAINAINYDVGKLKQAVGNRPIYVIAECSNQDIGKQDWTKQNDATGTPLSPKMRGPTVQEIILEWITFKRDGVAGVWWFPDMIGLGWEGFDGTQDDASGALTALDMPQK